jgi:hypothetical protein
MKRASARDKSGILLPINRDFCVTGGAKIRKRNRLPGSGQKKDGASGRQIDRTAGNLRDFPPVV